VEALQVGLVADGGGEGVVGDVAFVRVRGGVVRGYDGFVVEIGHQFRLASETVGRASSAGDRVVRF